MRFLLGCLLFCVAVLGGVYVDVEGRPGTTCLDADFVNMDIRHMSNCSSTVPCAEGSMRNGYSPITRYCVTDPLTQPVLSGVTILRIITHDGADTSCTGTGKVVKMSIIDQCVGGQKSTCSGGVFTYDQHATTNCSDAPAKTMSYNLNECVPSSSSIHFKYTCA